MLWERALWERKSPAGTAVRKKGSFAAEAARRRRGDCFLEKICGGQKEDCQEKHVHCCKMDQVFSLEAGKFLCRVFVGDQACHGGDQRSQTSQVGADEERGALAGKAGQQEGCRNVADDLADCHGAEKLIAGDQPLEHAAEPGDLLHVSDENEKSREGDQKRVIDLGKYGAVCKEPDADDRRQENGNGDPFAHRPQAEEKHEQIAEEAFPGHPGRSRHRLHLGNTKGKRFIFSPQEREEDQQQGQEGKGQHGAEKLAHSHLVVGIEVEVLRISNGSGHAAQVGGDGLKDDHRNQPVLAADHLQKLYGEGDKGDQRHVIGNEHAGEEAQEDQEKLQLPEALDPHQQALAHLMEKPNGLEPRHGGHEAEQKSQGVKIQVADVAYAGRNGRHG